MSAKVRCVVCGSENIDRLYGFRCFCKVCRMERGIEIISAPKPMNLPPQERTRRAVYATGNKWAIENYKATH